MSVVKLNGVTGKTKISQNDLRRIMSEQKKKLSETVKRIESPLSKYTDSGTLMCIVCNSVVRSEAVWSIHLNSKQHKENIARKKQPQFVEPAPPPPSNSLKKRLLTTEPPVPPKRLKGILKNSAKPSLPDGFFDTDKTTLQHDESPSPSPAVTPAPADTVAMETEASGDEADGKELPEGFFDDPVMDAKARNVEYKDPIQEEWEKFQKEMKEVTNVSAQIIEDDQEEATAERQIDEIDEQLRNWSRVLDLEVKKEEVQSVATRSATEKMEEESSEEDENFDEFPDWRAKKSFK